MNKEWKHFAEDGLSDEHFVYAGPGFYVSFNPAPCANIPMFASDGGGPETAIVIANRWLVLNGDHREAAEKWTGPDEALEYFRQHESERSTWSEEPAE